MNFISTEQLKEEVYKALMRPGVKLPFFLHGFCISAIDELSESDIKNGLNLSYSSSLFFIGILFPKFSKPKEYKFYLVGEYSLVSAEICFSWADGELTAWSIEWIPEDLMKIIMEE